MTFYLTIQNQTCPDAISGEYEHQRWEKGNRKCIRKKFACRSLKGKGARSGIRVVYAYFEKEDRIELIEFTTRVIRKTKIGRRY